MKFSNPYFTIEEKLSLLQRWILVHSMLYYRFNSAIATDQRFDDTCKQYIELRNTNPFAKGRYDYAFEGFDGSTGFDLESKLSKEDHWLVEYDVHLIINRKDKKLW